MRKRIGRRWLPCAAAGLALGLAGPQLVRADPVPAAVLLQQSTLVANQQSNVYAFTAPGPGTLTINLADVPWLAPLSSLGFSVDSTQNVLGTMSGPGQLTVNVSQAGTYYADVTGQAGGPLDLGVYSLQVGFQPQAAPVPLPDTILLTLCGLAMLGGLQLLWTRNERFTYVA
ncbi:MAG: hypothetical protein PVSMB6_08010 [Steroidobacteraceae bacterium]